MLFPYSISCYFIFLGHINKVIFLANSFSGAWDPRSRKRSLPQNFLKEQVPFPGSRVSGPRKGTCSLRKFRNKLLDNMYYLPNFNLEIFVFQKYSKFWSILVVHFIKHKPPISEEWVCVCHNKKWLVNLWMSNTVNAC